MPKQTILNILTAVAALFVALALVTLFPVSTGNENDLGYHSLCPFAPWSTLALLTPAALVWVIRGYIKAPSR